MSQLVGLLHKWSDQKLSLKLSLDWIPSVLFASLVPFRGAVPGRDCVSGHHSICFICKWVAFLFVLSRRLWKKQLKLRKLALSSTRSVEAMPGYFISILSLKTHEYAVCRTKKRKKGGIESPNQYSDIKLKMFWRHGFPCALQIAISKTSAQAFLVRCSEDSHLAADCVQLRHPRSSSSSGKKKRKK